MTQAQQESETADFINTTLEELYYQDEPIAESYYDDLFESTTQDDFIPSNWRTFE